MRTRSLLCSLLLLIVALSFTHPALATAAPSAVAESPEMLRQAIFAPAPPQATPATLPQQPEKDRVNKATCGPFFCTGTQVCVFCGNSYSCQPAGYTCCGPGFCDSTQTCVFCSNFLSCQPTGSSCCYNSICRPGQTCDSVSRFCR
jgi:hypothetical protein